MRVREDTQDLVGQLDQRIGFSALAQPLAGLMELPRISGPRDLTDPDIDVAAAPVGDLSQLIPGLRSWNGGQYRETGMAGACADEDPEIATMKSIAEAAERYAMTVVRPEEYVVASAEEIGDEAIDWRLFPRCHDIEPHQTVGISDFDPSQKVRWVKGVSLLDGECRYVPMALTHITTSTRKAEQFTVPISTGVAVHTDPYEAAARAILEVIERDAIALTWLLKIALPRIEIDTDPPVELQSRFQSFRNSQVKQYLFDATTDLGVPIVYGILASPGHPVAANVVTAACDLDPFQAAAKAMREAISTRVAVTVMQECPELPQMCVTLEHGAAFMGRPDRAHHFDFLVNNPARRPISIMQGSNPKTGEQRLLELVSRLRAKGMQAVAVDLTTSELAGVGLHAMRVTIPQLMPMSYLHNARFLGHDRLPQYAKYLGRAGFDIADVNTMPQPFA